MTLLDLESSLRLQPHHVSPFLMLGDPSPDDCVALARCAVDRGATMIELGIPFSDPCADGPAIQEACLRARAAGVSTTEALALVARIRAACPGVPLNLLVYGNLVHARGFEAFCRDAAAAGASTLLVPDIPIDEAGPLRAGCSRAGLGTVQLVAPLTSEQRLQRLDAAADLLYLAAHQGVTGADALDARRGDLVRRIAASVKSPICLGFGLTTGEQVSDAFASGAAIAVVGSHLARAIGSAWNDRPGDRQHLIAEFCRAFDPLIPQSSRTKS